MSEILSNPPAAIKQKRDVIDEYRAEYGPEVGDFWRNILIDMAAMADGQGHSLVRCGCEIASRMETRELAIAVLVAVEGGTDGTCSGVVRRVLGLA